LRNESSKWPAWWVSAVLMARCCSYPSAWDDMTFTIVFFDDRNFLLRSVGIKYPEANFFANEIKKRSSRQLMEEIFELRQGEYTSWKREDWICMSCWERLIYDTISTWWAGRRPQKMCGSDR